MCGIAGFIKLGEAITPSEVAGAFGRIQQRGPDALGVAYLTDDGWMTLKAVGRLADGDNREFVLDNIQDDKPNVALLHCRRATHGTYQVHNNNHPIIGSEYLLIHNGVVNPPVKYASVGETDTEQMVRHLEAVGVVEGLKTMGGWLAIAFSDLKKPKYLRLYTNGSAPLMVNYQPESGLMEFSSCPFAQALKARDDTLMSFDMATLASKDLVIPSPPRPVYSHGNATQWQQYLASQGGDYWGD